MNGQPTQSNRPNRHHLIRWSMLLLGGLILLGAITLPLSPVYGADILMPTETPTLIPQPTLQPPPELSALELFANGNQAYRDEDFERAINYYEQSIALDPRLKDAYVFLGWSYILSDDFSTALDIYNAIIAEYPDYSDFYLGRATSYNVQGDFHLAILDLNRAIELMPNNLLAYDIRGFTYGKFGNYEESLNDLNYVLELADESDSAYTYNNRGFARLHLGEIEAGLADINHSLKIDDTNPLAYHNRGLAYFMLEQPDRAIADYMQAITLGKDNHPLGYDEAESYRGLGDAYDAQGKVIPALRHYLTYVELAGDAADMTVLERIAEIEGD